MEYSISKAIQNLKPTVTRNSFPKLTATPSRNIIFPGIGHTIRKTNFIVSLPGYRNVHEVSKNIEKVIQKHSPITFH